MVSSAMVGCFASMYIVRVGPVYEVLMENSIEAAKLKEKEDGNEKGKEKKVDGREDLAVDESGNGEALCPGQQQPIDIEMATLPKPTIQ